MIFPFADRATVLIAAFTHFLFPSFRASPPLRSAVSFFRQTVTQPFASFPSYLFLSVSFGSRSSCFPILHLPAFTVCRELLLRRLDGVSPPDSGLGLVPWCPSFPLLGRHLCLRTAPPPLPSGVGAPSIHFSRWVDSFFW